MTTILTMIPTKACQTTRTMTPHYDENYHDHYLYHHVPNDDDYNNGRTNVISDDDKENSGNNEDLYDNHIPGHYRGAYEYGSNDPDVVHNYYED